jgi:hypothetical protein
VSPTRDAIATALTTATDVAPKYMWRLAGCESWLIYIASACLVNWWQLASSRALVHLVFFTLA